MNLLLACLAPASREEWERLWVQFMGERLQQHAERFSARTKSKLSITDALKVILWHAVDETWQGYCIKRQALTWLQEQFGSDEAPELVEEAVGALVGAAEDHRGVVLSSEEIARVRDEEQRAYDSRARTFRLAEPWEVQFWNVQVVEERAGQVVTGFFVRPRSYLAEGGDAEGKGNDAPKVVGFRHHWQGKQGAVPAAVFLTYNLDRATQQAQGWEFVSAWVALAEVLRPSVQKDTKVINRVPKGDIENGGQHLRAVEPKELREREQQARHAEQHVVAPTAQEEPGHPTLF
ncbi:hypothetical protein [Curtobacterium sp. MCBA15_001]|uniref:hypothetical protein n=1 Tax=Curtobacterium sp. MCBA15_001 TaxID=1898731 RepID=UPI0011145F9A|nr:hypothetical protein [Curtobacterium sp. MCBA15_001]